jgi:hypothetical protein
MPSTYLVHSIVWDTEDLDAQSLGLPDSVLIQGDIDQFADGLSDHFGWCILSLQLQSLEQLPPDTALPDQLLVIEESSGDGLNDSSV